MKEKKKKLRQIRGSVFGIHVTHTICRHGWYTQMKEEWIVTFLLMFFIEMRIFQLKYELINLSNSQGYQFYHQFSKVVQFCLTLWDPMDCSTSGFLAHHQLPELSQTHVHRAGDAIQLSHPLSSPSPPAFDLSQHQGLFKWVSSLHQVAKVFEFQLQNQSFQWIFRTDFL